MPYHKGKGHLYNAQTKRKFENEYGKKKGDKVFGAVVGKIKREREGHERSGVMSGAALMIHESGISHHHKRRR